MYVVWIDQRIGPSLLRWAQWSLRCCSVALRRPSPASCKSGVHSRQPARPTDVFFGGPILAFGASACRGPCINSQKSLRMTASAADTFAHLSQLSLVDHSDHKRFQCPGRGARCNVVGTDSHITGRRLTTVDTRPTDVPASSSVAHTEEKGCPPKGCSHQAAGNVRRFVWVTLHAKTPDPA